MMKRCGGSWKLAWLALICATSLAVAACGAEPKGTEVATETPAMESPASEVAAPTPVETLAATDELPTEAPTKSPEPEVHSPLPTGTAPPTVQSPTALPEPTASATALPEPTQTPTQTPLPTAEPAGPEIQAFAATPAEVRNVGDAVQLSWAAVGEQAELCSTNCFGPTGCQEVPLSGERSIESDEVSLYTNGFALRVTANGQTAIEAVTVRFLCENLRTWFFDPPPPYCPAGEPTTSYAAGQSFERGLMIWVEDTDEFYVFDSEPDPSGLLIYHSTVGLILKPGASEWNRVGEDPPAGLYEPVSGFGLIWRGEVEWPEVGDVRERLGWATEPEFGFDTTSQYAILACPRGWTAYVRGPHGEILRLGPASTAGWPLVWENVGP